MSELIQKERFFLLLLMQTSLKQQKMMIENITSSQLKAVVQIIFNVLQGVLKVDNVLKTKLKRRKKLIRQLIQKQLSFKKRKLLMIKNIKTIISLIKLIEEQRWLKN